MFLFWKRVRKNGINKQTNEVIYNEDVDFYPSLKHRHIMKPFNPTLTSQNHSPSEYHWRCDENIFLLLIKNFKTQSFNNEERERKETME